MTPEEDEIADALRGAREKWAAFDRQNERRYVEAVDQAMDEARSGAQWRGDREYAAAVGRALNGEACEHVRPRMPDDWPADLRTPAQLEFDLIAEAARAGGAAEVEPGVFRAGPRERCLFCFAATRKGMGPNSGPG
jgi:hypothetical protein